PTLTGSNGAYSFAGLLPNANYTITPAKTGYTFSPSEPVSSLSANQKNIDFVAAAPVVISGAVKNVNGRGLSGETVNLKDPVSGNVLDTKISDPSRAYSFNVLSGGSYDVAPSDSRVNSDGWFPLAIIHHSNLTQNVSNDDFEARTPTFTVSGVVKNSSNTKFSNVTVAMTGTIIVGSQKQVNANYVTNASGAYTSDQLNILGDYTFTPQTFINSGTTYSIFNPASTPFMSIPTCPSGSNCNGFSYLGVDFTASVSPPSAPTGTAATNVISSSFTANWSTSSGATGYRLDVSTSNTFNSFVSGFQDLDVGNALNRSVTGLSANTSYFYRVRAYNTGGMSGNSGTINVTTLPNAPSAPTANGATSVTSISFTANWSSSSGATGYRLDVSTSNMFNSFVSGFQDLDVGNALSRSVTGL